MTDQDPLSDIERLAALRDQGILGAEEFEAKKAELMAQVGQPAPAPLAGPVGAPPPSPEVAAMMRDQRINNAFLIEVIGGVLGFLGAGYLYAGRSNDGLVRLVAWWIAMGLMWTMVTLLSIVLIGLCLIPVAIAAQFGVPIYSAMQLKKLLRVEAGLPPE